MEVKVHQEILKQYSKEKYLGELNLFPLLPGSFAGNS